MTETGLTVQKVGQVYVFPNSIDQYELLFPLNDSSDLFKHRPISKLTFNHSKLKISAYMRASLFDDMTILVSE